MYKIQITHSTECYVGRTKKEEKKKKIEMNAFKSESIERCHKLTTHITTNKERHIGKEEEEVAISPNETG